MKNMNSYEKYKELINRSFDEYKIIYPLFQEVAENEKKLSHHIEHKEPDITNKVSEHKKYFATNEKKVLSDSQRLLDNIKLQSLMLILTLYDNKNFYEEITNLFDPNNIELNNIIDYINEEENNNILSDKTIKKLKASKYYKEGVVNFTNILINTFNDDSSDFIYDLLEIFNNFIVLKDEVYYHESAYSLECKNYLIRKQNLNLLKYTYSRYKLKNKISQINGEHKQNQKVLFSTVNNFLNEQQDWNDFAVVLCNFNKLKELYKLLSLKDNVKQTTLTSLNLQNKYPPLNYMKKNNNFITAELDSLFEDLDLFCFKNFNLHIDEAITKYNKMIKRSKNGKHHKTRI